MAGKPVIDLLMSEALRDSSEVASCLTGDSSTSQLVDVIGSKDVRSPAWEVGSTPSPLELLSDDGSNLKEGLGSHRVIFSSDLAESLTSAAREVGSSSISIELFSGCETISNILEGAGRGVDCSSDLSEWFSTGHTGLE